jgi:hypothetical protein
VRRLLALAAVLVAAPLTVLGTPAAQAGTCPLLVDVAGDALLVPGTPSQPDLDIRSADIASGATNVVVTLRLTTLSPSAAGRAPVRWAVGWHFGTGKYGVSLNRDQNGTYSAFVSNAGGQGSATVDVANASITWTVPRSAFSALSTPGTTFSSITAATQLLGLSTFTADEAATSQTYVDQTAGCIPAS